MRIENLSIRKGDPHSISYLGGASDLGFLILRATNHNHPPVYIGKP